MIDSDIDFVTITDDAAALMGTTYKDNKVPFITDSSFEIVVRTKSKASYDIPLCSKDLGHSRTLHNNELYAFLAATPEYSSQKAICWY